MGFPASAQTKLGPVEVKVAIRVSLFLGSFFSQNFLKSCF